MFEIPKYVRPCLAHVNRPQALHPSTHTTQSSEIIYKVKVDKFLIGLAAAVQGYALQPTSGFCVGAAVLGSSGTVFLGINIEMQGLPLNATIRAEQFATVMAL